MLRYTRQSWTWFSRLLRRHPARKGNGAGSGVGVRLKVGDKYWEDWRGGVWGGAVPSSIGGLGACPQKKINFALKIMQFWASFGTSFLYYSRKWGIIPQSWKWGDLSPCPPPLLRRLWERVYSYKPGARTGWIRANKQQKTTRRHSDWRIFIYSMPLNK